MPARDDDEGPPDGPAEHAHQPGRALAVLQAALLPAGVPLLPRVALGARYLLAEDDVAAGGDWYDTVVLSDGSIGLVVGDVVGHGLAATAAMGQLRAVAADRLESGAPPADVVTALDRFARDLPDAHIATVCVAVLEPTTGALRVSSAGHPPPLLVSAAGPRFLACPAGAPLATGGSYTEAEAQVADGDLLLLYTDGIVERPGVHPAQGSDDLVDAAAHLRDSPGGGLNAQRFCDDLLALLVRSTGYRDDITLLAAQRHAPLGRVELALPDTPVAVTATRAALEAWLAALGVDDLTATAIQHAVGEAVTNAVEHAYTDLRDLRDGPRTVEVRAELTDAGVVEIAVADHGRWRAPSEHPYRGMGLTMAVELIDDVRLDRRESGTTVRLRHRPRRAVRMSSRPAGTPIAPVPDEPFLAALTADDDPHAVLVVHGPVDAAGAVELRDQLRSITGNGTVSRSVDLSRVTLLASEAVRVLYEACDRSTAHHERLDLLAPRGSTAHHVLELVGLHPVDQI
jgi:anti-sigma regulatory factor (Ser/Thr protein kinase)/anti-anti-sigma regulatory factor